MLLFMTQLEMAVNDTDVSPPLFLPPRCRQSGPDKKEAFLSNTCLWLTAAGMKWNQYLGSLAISLQQRRPLVFIKSRLNNVEQIMKCTAALLSSGNINYGY